MKTAAAYAIEGIMDDGELDADHILPSIFAEWVKTAVSDAVKAAAREDGVCRT